MNWLVHHIDWALVGAALILSAVWASNRFVHPLTERPPMVIINDHYVPPKAPLPGSVPKSSTLS